MNIPQKTGDRKFILSSAGDFEVFLSSRVVFWRLVGSSMALSAGNLLLAMLTTVSLIDLEQDLELRQACNTINQIRVKKRSAWEQKTRAEIPGRLNQWKIQMEEYLDSGKISASYRYNCRVRVILELLKSELRFPESQLEKQLEILDEQLRLLSKPGEFIWEMEIIDLFPTDAFWFLYRAVEGRK